MKNLSLILTVFLILPIGYTLFSVYEMRLMESKSIFSHPDNFMTAQMLSYKLIDIFFIIVAVVLNAKQKYRENSIMCGTLLVSFLISVIINWGSSLLYNWFR